MESVIRSNVSQAPESGGPDHHTSWLATTNPDGTPHVMPLGTIWMDDAYYFTSGPDTRKTKNLADSPLCVITMATEPFDPGGGGGGDAVNRRGRVAGSGRHLRHGGGEPTVSDGAFVAEFSAPSAGPPPWYLFRLCNGEAEPSGATRWEF